MIVVDSPIFGNTCLLDETDKEFTELKKLVDDYPVTAFGLVNKKLNERGLCSSIATIKELQ